MTKSPWLAHYPKEVRVELPNVPFENLPAMLKAASTENAKTIAFTQVMPKSKSLPRRGFTLLPETKLEQQN